MMEKFKNRNVGFYLALASALLGLISAVIYIIIDNADRTFSLYAFILVLVGAVSSGLLFFFDFGFLPCIPALCYSGAFALSLRNTLPSVSDLWNGVNFIGGNAAVGIIFSVLFLLFAILLIVTSFTGFAKKR